ncbi:hypothetical protein B0H11DRAFT_1900570 [Mycena galericulata]|nr:hypothetical protein B0H11DRAFT_1900570 [Mycena galericulata]
MFLNSAKQSIPSSSHSFGSRFRDDAARRQAPSVVGLQQSAVEMSRAACADGTVDANDEYEEDTVNKKKQQVRTVDSAMGRESGRVLTLRRGLASHSKHRQRWAATPFLRTDKKTSCPGPHFAAETLLIGTFGESLVLVCGRTQPTTWQIQKKADRAHVRRDVRALLSRLIWAQRTLGVMAKLPSSVTRAQWSACLSWHALLRGFALTLFGDAGRTRYVRGGFRLGGADSGLGVKWCSWRGRSTVRDYGGGDAAFAASSWNRPR